MTSPVWIPFGPWRLHPHVFFESLGYATAVALVVWQRSRIGDALRRDQRVMVAAAALIGLADDTHGVATSWAIAFAPS